MTIPVSKPVEYNGIALAKNVYTDFTLNFLKSTQPTASYRGLIPPRRSHKIIDFSLGLVFKT